MKPTRLVTSSPADVWPAASFQQRKVTLSHPTSHGAPLNSANHRRASSTHTSSFPGDRATALLGTKASLSTHSPAPIPGDTLTSPPPIKCQHPPEFFLNSFLIGPCPTPSVLEVPLILSHPLSPRGRGHGVPPSMLVLCNRSNPHNCSPFPLVTTPKLQLSLHTFSCCCCC